MALSSAPILPQTNLQSDPLLALPCSPFSDIESFPLPNVRNQDQCYANLPSPQVLPPCTFNSFFPSQHLITPVSPSSLSATTQMNVVAQPTVVIPEAVSYSPPIKSDDDCSSIVSLESTRLDASPMPPPPVTKKRTYGTRERRYPCTAPGCGKSFAKKWNLQAHERLHTGIKPFRCRLGCKDSFMWMSSLKSHEKRKCPLLPESQRYRRKTTSSRKTSNKSSKSLPTTPTLQQIAICMSQTGGGSDVSGNRTEEKIYKEFEDILGCL